MESGLHATNPDTDVPRDTTEAFPGLKWLYESILAPSNVNPIAAAKGAGAIGSGVRAGVKGLKAAGKTADDVMPLALKALPDNNMAASDNLLDEHISELTGELAAVERGTPDVQISEVDPELNEVLGLLDLDTPPGDTTALAKISEDAGDYIGSGADAAEEAAELAAVQRVAPDVEMSGSDPELDEVLGLLDLDAAAPPKPPTGAEKYRAGRMSSLEDRLPRGRSAQS